MPAHDIIDNRKEIMVDQIVYEFYGLREEEMGVVGGILIPRLTLRSFASLQDDTSQKANDLGWQGGGLIR